MDTNTINLVFAGAATLLAAFAAHRSNQSKMKADEVGLLRDEVGRLHRQQVEQEKEINELRRENALLYRVLRRKGVDVETEIEALKHI